MLSMFFEVIGVMTVAFLAFLLAMVTMGWMVMLIDLENEDGFSMFSMGWNFDDTDDEYL